MNALFLPAVRFDSMLGSGTRLVLLLSLMLFSVATLGYLLSEQYDDKLRSVQHSDVAAEQQALLQAEIQADKADLITFVTLLSLLFVYLVVGQFLRARQDAARLRAACQALARGEFDLSPPAHKSVDEWGVLEEDIQTVSREFQRRLISVTEMAAEVYDAAGELNKLSRREAENASQQSGAVANIASAIQQTSASTEQIVEKTTAMTDVAEQSSQQAEVGGGVVKEAIKAIREVSETVSIASTQVDNLGQSSARINNIIEVIQDIAAQTNLLALNAAIEAARAGEHGRGFAVVSDEVRQLATRTHEATDEVREMIDTVQAEITHIVESIKNTHLLVDQGVTLVNTAGENLDGIQAGVTTTLAATQEISLVVREQNLATQEIAASVETINTMVADNSVDIADASATASYLEALSGRMLTASPGADAVRR